MSTQQHLAVITQQEFEPKLLPNANMTTSIPYLATLSVPQFPKTQWTRVAPPSPETKKISVQGHIRGSVPPTKNQGQASWKQQRVQDHPQIQEQDWKTKAVCLS
jgi:hypothetical protein